MSNLLRILLFVVSLFTFIFITRKLKKSQFKTEDAFFWIVFSFVLIFVSWFPQIGIICAELLGVQSAVNFIFLVIIFLLIIRCFMLTMRITILESKLSDLIQIMAIRSRNNDNNKEN